MKTILRVITPFCLPLAWLTAAIATFGSLFSSVVLHFAPCDLCWYQRIFMYPLVFMLGIGLFRRPREVALYTLPLAAFGWLIALYQNLLYYRFITPFIPCTTTVPCDARFLNWLGFIDFPLLSLLAFTAIIILVWVASSRADSAK